MKQVFKSSRNSCLSHFMATIEHVREGNEQVFRFLINFIFIDISSNIGKICWHANS